jgi:hypothetical protein
MTPVDRKQFAEVVLGFAELKGKQLSAPAIELYWRSMQHWSLEDFLAAAEQLIRSSEFMPTPKDFEDLRKAGRRTAGEAWTIVLDYARHNYSRWDSGLPCLNSNAAPEPDDELLMRAVRAIGGFKAVACSPVDKTPFLERRFCEHYEAMRDADDVREAVPQIAYSKPKTLSGPASVRDMLPSHNDWQ